MAGIWTSPDTFVEFEAPGREDLARELYTPNAAMGFDPSAWIGYLPDPDPVLVKTGDGVQVLRELTADPKVLSSIQLRKVGTLKKKEFTLAAGKVGDANATPEAERLASDLRADLEDIDLYNLWSQVLDAPFFGSTVFEIVWQAVQGRMRIARLRQRPHEWFGWDSDDVLKFKGLQGALAEPVPEDKAVAVRHFPDASNPYGLRLLSRCLWPVAIKKGGIRFWTTLCERFGMPWVIGKARSGALKAERQDMLSNLSQMVQDAVAVVTAGSEVNVHTITGTAGDLHPALVRYMDSAIAMVLMGQTLTADIGSNGSRAASETHYDVLGDLRDADETLICTFMENLAWTYGQVNAPGVPTPTFAFVEPEDHSAQADLDKKLKEAGVRFTRPHFTRRYGLAEDEFEVEGATVEPGGKGQGAGGPEFAAAALRRPAFTPDQQALEGLIGAIMPDAVGITARIGADIDTLIRQAKDFEDLKMLLLAAMDQADPDLENLLQRGLVAADMHGRAVVGADDDGA
jgi:phage gp29-like protein